MKKTLWIGAAGLAALAPVLMALPGRSSAGQQNMAEPAIVSLQTVRVQEPDNVTVLIGEEGPSWLGVEAREVTPENVKEFKLPAERGVVVGHVSPDSSASKAGLKDTDVITEVDGQRVEGAAQFRRMIREIPAGRSVQLTLWREGRAQTISATLAQAEENRRTMVNAEPGAFAFRLPNMEIPDMPDGEG